MKTVKNDTRYIIKRIIIGVGIALILAFINNNKVFAEEKNIRMTLCFDLANDTLNNCSADFLQNQKDNYFYIDTPFRNENDYIRIYTFSKNHNQDNTNYKDNYFHFYMTDPNDLSLGSVVVFGSQRYILNNDLPTPPRLYFVGRSIQSDIRYYNSYSCSTKLDFTLSLGDTNTPYCKGNGYVNTIYAIFIDDYAYEYKDYSPQNQNWWKNSNVASSIITSNFIPFDLLHNVSSDLQLQNSIFSEYGTANKNYFYYVSPTSTEPNVNFIAKDGIFYPDDTGIEDFSDMNDYWAQGFINGGNDFIGELTNGGLTDIFNSYFGLIKVPFDFLRSLSRDKCSSISIPIPFTNSNMQINCLSSKFRSVLGENFYNFLFILITGLYAYRITIMNIDTFTDIMNPDDDKLEVIDL